MVNCKKLYAAACACAFSLAAFSASASAEVVLGGFWPPAFECGVEASPEWENGVYLWKSKRTKIAELSGAKEDLRLPVLTSGWTDDAVKKRFGQAYAFPIQLDYRLSIGGDCKLTLYNPYYRSTFDNFFLYRAEPDGTLTDITKTCKLQAADGVPYSFTFRVDKLGSYVLSNLHIEDPVGLERLEIRGTSMGRKDSYTLEKTPTGGQLRYWSEGERNDPPVVFEEAFPVTEEEWLLISQTCTASGTHGWLPVYQPPFEIFDSWSWEFDAAFEDGSTVASEGYAITPHGFYDIYNLLEDFKERGMPIRAAS